MEPNVADTVISVCELLALEHKHEIFNSKNKKFKKKCLIGKRVAKRNELGRRICYCKN
jgi:hypothetical protein